MNETTINKLEESRSLGVDVAKIVAAFLVVVLHLSKHGIKVTAPSGGITSNILYVVVTLSCTCIDIFALATGYLCIASRCKMAKLIKLWIVAVFWGCLGVFFSKFIMGIPVRPSCFIDTLFPIFRSQYWFFTAYFMLFFFMPLLNAGIRSLEVKEFRRIFVAIFVFLSGYSVFCFGRNGGDHFQMHHGFSFAWLAVVYVIGGYIRKMDRYVKLRPVVCFAMALSLVFLSAVVRFLISALMPKVAGSIVLCSYTSPFVLAASIFLFVGCINIRFANGAPAWLKPVAATSFGVYLIHAQPYVFDNIWQRYLSKVEVSSAVYLVPVIVGIGLGAFLGLVLLEHLRLCLFRRIGL